MNKSNLWFINKGGRDDFNDNAPEKKKKLVLVYLQIVNSLVYKKDFIVIICKAQHLYACHGKLGVKQMIVNNS